MTINASRLNYSLSMLGYIFLAKTPLSIFLVDSYYKVVHAGYRNAFNALFHQIARNNFKDKMVLFGAAWQMLLCFGELIVLPLYALIAYFIGMNIFYVTAIASIIGLLMTSRYFNKKS